MKNLKRAWRKQKVQNRPLKSKKLLLRPDTDWRSKLRDKNRKGSATQILSKPRKSSFGRHQ